MTQNSNNINNCNAVQPKSNQRYVIKRDGRHEAVHPEKITSRVSKLCYGLDMRYVNPVRLQFLM